MEKTLVKKYIDTFGIENVIIITDNTKVYRNGQGRNLIIDLDKEVCHSICFENEDRSVAGKGMFELESFEFGEIQFMSCNASVKNLEDFLQTLILDKTITIEKAESIVNGFKGYVKAYMTRDEQSVLADTTLEPGDEDFEKYKYHNVPTQDKTEYIGSLNTPIYRKNDN